jgi:beta-lactamase class C
MYKMLVPYLLVSLSLLSTAASALSVPANNFERALDVIGNSDDVVGLAVAVVRDGDVSLLETYGVRQVGGAEKITPQTTFRIASLSKAFAATVAVQLDLEDKISLSDSITAFNQNFQLKNQAQADFASLNHVLSHRLSLPPYAYDNLLESGVKPPKILRQMKQVEPICEVGSCYAYQNVGFNMIASVVEAVDKMAYSRSVKSRVFEPIEMVGASFGKESLVLSDNWAQSHKRNRGGPWEPEMVKQAYYDVPAAGGVNANITDMAKWLAAQMGHYPQSMPEAVLRRLHTPQTRTRSELRRMRHLSRVTDAYYGLGWRVYEYAGATVVNHSGSVEGYAAQIAFLPDQNVGIVLLSNSKSKQFWKILPSFLDQELGLKPNS